MTLKNQTSLHGLYQSFNAYDINACQYLGIYYEIQVKHCFNFAFETLVYNSNWHGVKNRVRSNDGGAA